MSELSGADAENLKSGSSMSATMAGQRKKIKVSYGLNRPK